MLPIIEEVRANIRELALDRRQARQVAWQTLRARLPRRSSPATMSRIEASRTVGLILGPYRNLTTLLVAALALHPDCAVLNHAAIRILPDRRHNFIRSPDQMTLARFFDHARDIARSGRRGAYGGSILLSHAFDDPALKAAYSARHLDAAGLNVARAVVWKDSMRVERALRVVDVDEVMRRLPQVRLILPIRSPVACALSNMRTGHARFMVRDGPRDLARVLEAIIESFAFFAGVAERFPDRCLAFTERELDAECYVALADLLGLPAPAQWLEDVASCVVVRRSRTPDADATALARERVAGRLQHHPRLRDRVLATLE